MNNSKNKLSLALLAVLCIVMVAMGIWGFTLGNTVTLSAAELAAPAATEAPAEEAEAATEEAAAEETAEEAAAGEELAEVAEDSAASLQESAIAEHLAERSGLQSFAYLKRFPLLITGILLGARLRRCPADLGQQDAHAGEHTAFQADLRRGRGAGHPHGLPVDPAGLLLHPL